MASVFISYSRKDIEIARKLTGRLNGRDLDFWIDWEGIPPTVDWWKEIEKGIEEADIFLFLISPDSCQSNVCKREIEHAAKHGKRLIPVVVRDIKAERAPAELSTLNWIFLRGTDEFDPAFGKLITAIKTDYDWVQVHRQLLVKALEWEKNDHKNAFLLRGEELQHAELQIVANASKGPHPTDLQRTYVLSSRQASDRQRRNVTGLAIGVVIALAALSIVAFMQAAAARSSAATAVANASIAETERASAITAANARATAQANAEANQRLADERAKISRAGELAAQSSEMLEKDFQISLLLGIEALGVSDTLRSRAALLDSANTHPQLLQYLMGHRSEVITVAFSPDRKTLASGGADGTIILWDMQTRRPIDRPLGEHTGSVNSVTFSPDGLTLASGGADGAIILWDLATALDTSVQIHRQTLRTDTAFVYSLAFSPDGKTLASGHRDRIILWDVSTVLNIGVETRPPIGQPLAGHIGPVNSVTFSPDGKTLASGSWDKTIILWDVPSRQPIGEPLRGHADTVSSVAFSPDGKTLASGSYDFTIMLWDLSTLSNTSLQNQQFIGQPLMGHTDAVTSVAFSPDGKTLASGSRDIILLWDLSTVLDVHAQTRQFIGQPLMAHTSWVRPLTGHTSWINNVAFSPDGKTLASASNDQAIILWNVETRWPMGQALMGHAGAVTSVAFSPDGKTLASGSWDKTIILWDVPSRQPIGQPVMGHTAEVTSVAFSPDGKTLASGSVDKTIILWDVPSRQPIGQPLEGHAGPVRSVAFSPDGKNLASGSLDGTIILWDAETHQLIGQPVTGPEGVVSSVAFSPDGMILASASDGGTIILWDVPSLQRIGQPLTGPAHYLYSVSFSPDGKTLASGSSDSTFILWDLSTVLNTSVQTRQPIGQPFTGHADAVNSVAFSPDGKTLASGSCGQRPDVMCIEGEIILWDAETRQPIGRPLRGHTSWVNSVAFSPDGKTLASGGGDGIIILWNLKPQSWIEQSCQRAGRNFTRAEWAQYFPDREYRKTCEQWLLESEVTAAPSPAP